MMKYCLITLSVVIFACRTEKLHYQQQLRITSEVKSALTETFADIARYGFTAEIKHLDHSPGFFWIPPGRSNPVSFDSVAAILRLYAPVYRSVVSIWDTIHVLPLNRKIASYTGRFHSTYTDTGGKVTRFNMMEAGVAIKRKSRWLLINGQTSSVPGK